ncbi:MAG: helix-turn-helix domain-containing protein [Faecousia sp.]
MQIDLLDAFRAVAKAYNFNFTVVTPPFTELEQFDYGLRKSMNPGFDFSLLGQQLLRNIPKNTFVISTDELECSYAAFALPDRENTVYLYGPVICKPITEDTLLRFREQYGEETMHIAACYYQSIHTIDSSASLSAMLGLYSTVCPDSRMERVAAASFFPISLLPSPEPKQAAVLAQLEDDQCRQKSQLEGQLMRAIAMGDSKLATTLLSSLEAFTVPEILRSPLLNLKIQMLSVNALCRLAACRVPSVHPIYVEKLYHQYTAEAEHVSNVKEMTRSINRMVYAYCECIQTHSLQDYSPLIQRVVNYIQLHPEEDMSLRFFARTCNISSSYLSNLFRKETGVTLTEYINRCRVEKAAILLQYTDQNIAQVGEAVGFLDENYFTRIFKKVKGVPPTVFRKTASSA